MGPSELRELSTRDGAAVESVCSSPETQGSGAQRSNPRVGKLPWWGVPVETLESAGGTRVAEGRVTGAKGGERLGSRVAPSKRESWEKSNT